MEAQRLYWRQARKQGSRGLEDDKTIKPRVLRLVDHTHASAAEPFHDTVAGDGLANQRNGVRHFAHILGCVKRQVNEDDLCNN